MGFISDIGRANLRPHAPFKSGTEAQEMGRKGGSVKSARKSLSAKLRELKHKGFDNEQCQWLYEMMTNDELASFYVLQQITKCTDPSKPMPLKDQRELTRLLLDWKKMQHGTKETHQKIDVTSMSVDVKFVVPAEFSKQEVLDEREVTQKAL
jgi:hypothetical protein